MSVGARALSDRLKLARSGLEVSPFCLGMVGTPDVVLAAFEAGVNFFFITADMHWPLYAPTREGLRRLLQKHPSARERIVVAVVSYVTQPEFCYAPFCEVLDELPELGHIDLGVIGGSYPADFFVRLAEYERLRPAGMRGIGATFHHRASAVTAIRHELLDVAFIRYNPGHYGAELDVFPHLPAERACKLFNFKSTSAYVPESRLEELGVPGDNWVPDLTDHYRFALRRPEIDGVLCGLESPEFVDGLRETLAAEPLSEAEADYLKTLAELDRGELELDKDEEAPENRASSA
jgi:hypothetical protein